METQETQEIHNVAYFLTKLEELVVRKKIKQPIFRGQLDSYDENGIIKPIMSTAARRLHKNQGKDLLSQSRFIEYHKDLIEKARNNKYDMDINTSKLLFDLEILAQIQHYGGATCLVDFTKNFLTALWFATAEKNQKKPMENPKNKNQPENGRIYIIDVHHEGGALGFMSPKIIHAKNIEQILKIEITGEEYKVEPESRQKFWIWTPDRINNRIFRQDSIFVFGLSKFENEHEQPRLYYELEIPQDDKKAIRYELERYFNITAETIYSDLPGFSGEANRSDKKAGILENSEPCIETAKLFLTKKEYEQADNYLNQALSCCQSKVVSCPRQVGECLKRTDKKHLSDIYYLKGECCYEEDNHKKSKALSFYHESLRLYPDNLFVYEELMHIYYELKQYGIALKYADKLVDKNPIVLFDMVELSMFMNDQKQYLEYKQQIESNKDLYKEMAKTLLLFFDTLNSSVNLGKHFDYNQIATDLFSRECDSYRPYWVYDDIKTWLSSKKTQIASKEDEVLNESMLLTERMIEKQKELVYREYENKQY